MPGLELIGTIAGAPRTPSPSELERGFEELGMFILGDVADARAYSGPDLGSRWLCRLAGGETDRATGIARLKLTAEKGHYLAPFARLLLAVAALRDHDAGRARNLLEALAREYPHNPLYRQELARMARGEAAR